MQNIQDAILNITWFFECGEKHEMSTEATGRMRRKLSIPSSNHWQYLLNFQQVHESVRVSKEGVANLCCRSTHCIRLQQTDYKENDGLYAMYCNRVGQSPDFMREWLHYFVTVVYKTHFKRIGFTYLTKK